MNKKAATTFQLVMAVLAIALLVLIIVGLIAPIKELLFGSGIGVCEDTSKTADEYQTDIELLSEDFDVKENDKEKQEDIVKLYKEFANCFPDNNFDGYMETVKEGAVYNFIFVMKEQKHYDKTTLKIAERFLIKYPANSNISTVRAYVNEAKTAVKK